MILEMQRVRKTYGQTVAVDDVQLTAARGEIIALLGPNGAGKTSTLEMVLGLRQPTGGTVRVFGGDPRERAVRSRIGATPQETGYPGALRLSEIASMVASAYRRPCAIDEVFTRFGLLEMKNRVASTLSGGELRRLNLALSFLASPELVVLDEPTTGLDIGSRRAVWDSLHAAVDAGTTVLFSTHYLEEIDELDARVVVMDHGRICFDGTSAQMRARMGGKRVSYVVDGKEEKSVARDADAFVRDLVMKNIAFENLCIEPIRLDDAFLELTGANAA